MKYVLSLALFTIVALAQETSQDATNVSEKKEDKNEKLWKQFRKFLDEKKHKFFDKKKEDKEEKILSQIEKQMSIDTEDINIRAKQKGDANLSWHSMFMKGSCPANLGMKDLDFVKLTGDWYLHETNDQWYADNNIQCFHVNREIKEDGTFKAIHEFKVNGKDRVNDNLTGIITKDSFRTTNLFDMKNSMKWQILDTDYQNYVIDVLCLDHMMYAFDTKLEPAHKLKINIFTRKPEVDLKLIKTVENKVAEKMSDFKDFQFIKVSHEKEANCQYRSLDFASKKKTKLDDKKVNE